MLPLQLDVAYHMVSFDKWEEATQKLEQMTPGDKIKVIFDDPDHTNSGRGVFYDGAFLLVV